MSVWYAPEPFTPDERRRLEPHFTNLDGPVFALTNLPEAVKGALFARYSRTTKSLRRLFLDEFATDVAGGRRRRPPRSVANGPPSSTGGSSSSTGTTPWRSSVASTWPASSRPSSWPRRWNGAASARTSSNPPGTCATTTAPAGAGAPPSRRSSRAPQLEERYLALLDESFTAYGRMYDRLDAWFRERYPKTDARQRLRLRPDDHGQDLRHAPHAAPRRDPVERGDLRDGPELRATPDAVGAASARGDARLRPADARGAPEGDPGVPRARRRRGTRRRLERVLALRA